MRFFPEPNRSSKVRDVLAILKSARLHSIGIKVGPQISVPAARAMVPLFTLAPLGTRF